MYVKVLFDQMAKKGLLSGKGFSCLVDGKILFDTGGTSAALVENMDRMMVSVEDLEGVVISHDHWDHTDGLWEILRRKKGLKVYVCPETSETFIRCIEELGGKPVLVECPTEIVENIFVVGGMKGIHKGVEISEQVLVVRGDNGLSVVTGCAHPGIVKVLEVVKDKLGVEKIYMAFGGFHLDGFDKAAIEKVIGEVKEMGLIKVGPTHCSGEKARRMFSGRYHENYIAVKAGHIIHL
ncbi:MAG: MBL fold metallo-hydrolase [Candidatus Omnitrophota bacterium]